MINSLFRPLHWLYLGLIVGLIIGAPYSTEWRDILVFSTEQPWQLWRLLSGHFSHWSWAHWGLNISGLFVYILLFYPHSGTQWRQKNHCLDTAAFLRALLFVLLCSNLYLVFAFPLSFYLGFSSLLYGVYAYSAVRCFPAERMINGAILLIIGLQIQPWFILHDSKTLIGLSPAKDVHLVAVLSGLVMAFGEQGLKVIRSR